MNWVFEMIHPIIKDCETPQEAETKVRQWCETVHPRDAFCGLIAVWMIERDWTEYKKIKKVNAAIKKATHASPNLSR